MLGAIARTTAVTATATTITTVAIDEGDGQHRRWRVFAWASSSYTTVIIATALTSNGLAYASLASAILASVILALRDLAAASVSAINSHAKPPNGSGRCAARNCIICRRPPSGNAHHRGVSHFHPWSENETVFAIAHKAGACCN